LEISSEVGILNRVKSLSKIVEFHFENISVYIKSIIILLLKIQNFIITFHFLKKSRNFSIKYLLNYLKGLLILVYFIYSSSNVSHTYNGFTNRVVEKIKTEGVKTEGVKTEGLTNVSLDCREIIDLPFFYSNFSGCFNNYSWAILLDRINLNNSFVYNLVFPIVVYTALFIVIRCNKFSLSKYFNLILLVIVPNLFAKILGIGLNGIESENDNRFLLVLRVLYLNLFYNSTEVSTFGPEMRQAATFICVLTIYSISQNYSKYKVLYLLVILSFVHIYIAILFTFVLILMFPIKPQLSNLIVIFSTVNTLTCIYLNNGHIFSAELYFLYHLILFGLISLFHFKDIKNYSVSISHKDTSIYLLKYVLILTSLQIIFAMIRHEFYVELPTNQHLSALVLYEKSAGIIERISMITRPITLLSLLYGIRAISNLRLIRIDHA